MRTERLPTAELSLPHDALTNRVNRPRSNEILHLHVHALEHVKTQVLAVDEVCTVHTAVFIVDERHTVMRHTLEAEVEHALTLNLSRTA